MKKTNLYPWASYMNWKNQENLLGQNAMKVYTVLSILTPAIKGAK